MPKRTRRTFLTAISERAKDEVGALQVNGVADEGVDDFHEGGLDGFLILAEGDGVKAGVGRSGDAAHHALGVS
jgi:hypothetical protein